MKKAARRGGFFFALRRQYVFVVPEVDEPVEPLVPELLLVPDEDGVGLVVVVELPEAPMPEVVELLLEGADMELEPLTEPPAEPMPDVLPEAVPVLLQAARAATQRAVKAIFNIINSPVSDWNACPADRRGHELRLPERGRARRSRRAGSCVGENRIAGIGAVRHRHG